MSDQVHSWLPTDELRELFADTVRFVALMSCIAVEHGALFVLGYLGLPAALVSFMGYVEKAVAFCLALFWLYSVVIRAYHATRERTRREELR